MYMNVCTLLDQVRSEFYGRVLGLLDTQVPQDQDPSVPRRSSLFQAIIVPNEPEISISYTFIVHDTDLSFQKLSTKQSKKRSHGEESYCLFFGTTVQR